MARKKAPEITEAQSRNVAEKSAARARAAMSAPDWASVLSDAGINVAELKARVGALPPEEGFRRVAAAGRLVDEFIPGFKVRDVLVSLVLSLK